MPKNVNGIAITYPPMKNQFSHFELIVLRIRTRTNPESRPTRKYPKSAANNSNRSAKIFAPRISPTTIGAINHIAMFEINVCFAIISLSVLCRAKKNEITLS